MSLEQLKKMMKDLDKLRRENIKITIKGLYYLCRMSISLYFLRGPKIDKVEEFANIKFSWKRYVKYLKKELKEEYNTHYNRIRISMFFKISSFQKKLKKIFDIF